MSVMLLFAHMNVLDGVQCPSFYRPRRVYCIHGFVAPKEKEERERQKREEKERASVVVRTRPTCTVFFQVSEWYPGPAPCCLHCLFHVSDDCPGLALAFVWSPHLIRTGGMVADFS